MVNSFIFIKLQVTIKKVYEIVYSICMWYFNHRHFYGWLYNTPQLYIVSLNRITKLLTKSFIHIKQRKKERALIQYLNSVTQWLRAECWQRWITSKKKKLNRKRLWKVRTATWTAGPTDHFQEMFKQIAVLKFVLVMILGIKIKSSPIREWKETKK